MPIIASKIMGNEWLDMSLKIPTIGEYLAGGLLVGPPVFYAEKSLSRHQIHADTASE